VNKPTHRPNGKFAPGNQANPSGKPVGTCNKTTKQIREAYQSFVEGKLDKVEGWFDDVAAKDPAQALDLMLKFSEYFVPKLARHVDGDGNDIKYEFILKKQD
jgi:hypothetical protein